MWLTWTCPLASDETWMGVYFAYSFDSTEGFAGDSGLGISKRLRSLGCKHIRPTVETQAPGRQKLTIQRPQRDGGLEQDTSSGLSSRLRALVQHCQLRTPFLFPPRHPWTVIFEAFESTSHPYLTTKPPNREHPVQSKIPKIKRATPPRSPPNSPQIGTSILKSGLFTGDGDRRRPAPAISRHSRVGLGSSTPSVGHLTREGFFQWTLKTTIRISNGMSLNKLLKGMLSPQAYVKLNRVEGTWRRRSWSTCNIDRQTLPQIQLKPSHRNTILTLGSYLPVNYIVSCITQTHQHEHPHMKW